MEKPGAARLFFMLRQAACKTLRFPKVWCAGNTVRRRSTYAEGNSRRRPCFGG